jgi:hypothetical protein
MPFQIGCQRTVLSSGKIVGTAFRGPVGAPRSVPTILSVIEWAAKEIPKRITFAAARPYRAEKSRAWLRHRIALQCSPGCLRAGFDSVKGEANPA